MTEPRLNSCIYNRCLEHLADVRDFDFVVSNSLPIPYFGNLAEYLDSRLRVLTAALNPSHVEFPEGKPRFDVDKGLLGPAELEKQLSAYFTKHPYRQWFLSFERVLNGLKASYGGKMSVEKYSSTALHVDMCSPIATSPTWSRLAQKDRANLIPEGRAVFEQLIDELKPHIIIASIGWGHLNAWNDDFSEGRNWERFVEYHTAANGEQLMTSLLVQINKLTSKQGHSFLFVNASAANTPFGKFTTERKQAVGRKLLERLESTP